MRGGVMAGTRRLEQSTSVDRFYQLLLRFHDVDAHSVLDEALQLLAQVTSAKLAYVELIDEDGGASCARGYHVDRRDPREVILSRDVDRVRPAIAEGKLVALPAKRDVGAILCVPIRSDAAIGFLWLQGKPSAFSARDLERAMCLGARLADAGLVGARPTLDEETRAFRDRRVREAVRRWCGNVAGAARELDVSRPFIYKVLEQRAAEPGTDCKRR